MKNKRIKRIEGKEGEGGERHNAVSIFTSS